VYLYSIRCVHLSRYINKSCGRADAVAGYSFSQHAAMSGFTWR